MENKGQPYSISSSTKTLSCASGAPMYIMDTCLLDVAIQGQTTENLQFFICHDKHCHIGAQAKIGRPGMKKLRLMKRTKEVAGIELSELIEKDPYPIQAKHEFRIPPRTIMPVSFENKLPDKLLFCTEINKDQESLEGLTIVPGILDNEAAELLCINFTNSV